MLIESGQALYRADNYHFPNELWSVKDQTWKPYTGKTPKEPAWGDVISEADAEELKKSFLRQLFVGLLSHSLIMPLQVDK